MRPENEAKLRKIKRISGILRAICKVFLVLIVLGLLAGMGALVVGRGSIGYFDVWLQVNKLTLGRRLLVLAMSTLISAVMFKCIYHLHRLFGNYSHGEIFTRESVGQLRQLGITCVLWGGMKVLWALMPLVLWRQSIAGVHVRADSIPIGIVIIVVAWFMDMAVEMREENELTV
jgi:hypothetical protein